jgi:hypothetical protein
MNTEIFKTCEVCGENIFIYKGIAHDVVGRDDIKVWHYDCRVNNTKHPDDLAVRVFNCTGPLGGRFVISYMTEKAVENIDLIFPNSYMVEVTSSIIRTPILKLEKTEYIKKLVEDVATGLTLDDIVTPVAKKMKMDYT